MEAIDAVVRPRSDGPGASPPSSDATADLANALARRVQGEVRFDPGSRALYATDLSIYRQVPIGVVIPALRRRRDRDR